MKKYYTAESVTEGHPDKLCDIIADSVLDDYLAHDPASHVACEVRDTKPEGERWMFCCTGKARTLQRG